MGTHTHTHTLTLTLIEDRHPMVMSFCKVPDEINQPKWPLLIDFASRAKLENTLGACKTALVQERRILVWVLTSQNGTHTQKDTAHHLCQPAKPLPVRHHEEVTHNTHTYQQSAQDQF